MASLIWQKTGSLPGFYFLEAEVVLDKGEKFLLDKEPPFWLGRVG
jgi:hypothetical protein